LAEEENVRPWFDTGPVEDAPGWFHWAIRDETSFNFFLGPMHSRLGGDGYSDDIARVRMFPTRRHRNLGGAVHGGTIAGFLDCAIFAAAYRFGLVDVAGAVTLDLQIHFVGPGILDEPLEAQVQLVRETGSMLFQQGIVVQKGGDHRVASFNSILKKVKRRG